jgi:hypothetical protein
VACIHLIGCSGRTGPSQGSGGYDAAVPSAPPPIDSSLAALLGRPAVPDAAIQARVLGFR